MLDRRNDSEAFQLGDKIAGLGILELAAEKGNGTIAFRIRLREDSAHGGFGGVGCEDVRAVRIGEREDGRRDE